MTTTLDGSPVFRDVATAPPDPILSLTEHYRGDSRSDKLNLGVGVYVAADGTTPVLAAVKAAEERILREEVSKSYLPIPGTAEYASRVRELVLGPAHPAVAAGRSFTLHSPGGTGALRVFLETLQRVAPQTRVWVSDPTWVNHGPLLDAVGLEQRVYPYFDPSSQGLAFDAMVAALEGAVAGDVVVLHSCCHNPSGVDLSADQWSVVAELVARRQLLPLFDFAYQGFGDGLDADAAGMLKVIAAVPEAAVCSSFSKNLGLYRERVGALTMITADARETEPLFSQAKRAVRSLYSSPPSHGGTVAAMVLSDDHLRRQWLAELDAMRQRVVDMRQLLAACLDDRGLHLHPQGNDFLRRQRGMFSFTGLGPEQVDRMRDEQAVYMVRSGRINVAGLNERTVPRLVDALAAIL